MNHEIELKLRLNPSELPLLEQVLATDPFMIEPTLQLLNQYYDTPTMALSQAGAALRIRQQTWLETSTTDIIQTLKTRGSSRGGLHQRMEWDWPLTEVALDLTRLQHSEVQSHLSSDLNLTAITSLFTTDFQRKVWLYNNNDTVIELVLDCGHVATTEHSIELLELELELKQGNADILFQLAEQIAQQCPVVMSDISKAERGYGLLARSDAFKGLKKDWQGKLPAFDDQQNVIAAFSTFFSYQLSVLQRTLETTLWDAIAATDKESIARAHCHQQLIQMQNLLMLFSRIDCLPDAQLLQRQLQQGVDSPFNISLIWGQLTLACGQWLYQLTHDSTGYSMTDEEKSALQAHAEQLKTMNGKL